MRRAQHPRDELSTARSISSHVGADLELSQLPSFD